jgi:Tol biopolymer transport system component
VVATVASLGLAATQLRRPAAPPLLRPVRFLFTGPDSAQIVENYPWPAAISPDGGTLVYAASPHGGATMLYSRRSDQLEGRPIPGTSSGAQPLFSPDGQWVAFEAGSKEKKVRLDGSAPVTIAEGGWANGADWTTTDELVVGSTRKQRGLLHVPVAGGELAQLTRPDSAKGELDHLWPIALPDGRTIVFTVWSGSLTSSQLAMTSLGDGKVFRLGLKGIRPLAVLDGALVYVQADGAVMAVPLDVAHKRVNGSPMPVLDPVPVGVSNNGNSSIFVSRGGALVSSLATHRARLTWIDRSGVARPVSPEVRDFTRVRLSPDGRRLATVMADGSKSDVWIYEIETGTLSRLTSSESVTSVGWTRDGSRVVYSGSGTGSGAAAWAQSVDVATPAEKLAEFSAASPSAELAPDGRSLLLPLLLENGWDVVRVALDSSHTFREFSASKAAELNARFSPDGRWAAIVSDESGPVEVYVRSYPEPTVKLQVSVGGGDAPVWSADGTRLYYYSGNAIVEARLATAPALRVVSRDTAFTQIRQGDDGYGGATFDVSHDGSRIVIPVSESAAYSLVVVPNWLTEFRQHVAAARR